jgi:hypothetical protein
VARRLNVNRQSVSRDGLSSHRSRDMTAYIASWRG